MFIHIQLDLILCLPCLLIATPPIFLNKTFLYLNSLYDASIDVNVFQDEFHNL